MSSDFNEWWDTIGKDSLLEGKNFAHAAWCAALCSEVEKFTSTNKQSDAIFCTKHGKKEQTVTGEYFCSACNNEYWLAKNSTHL